MERSADSPSEVVSNASVPLAEAPFINPFDPAVQADPDAAFAELRAETSVARTPLGARVAPLTRKTA